MPTLPNPKSCLLGASAALLVTAPGCLGLLAAAALADAIPCEGKFVDELQDEDGLSEECREDIAPYLPDPAQSFDGRVLTLGAQAQADGSLAVYLHGADDSGRALTAADFAAASFRITVGGETVELEGEDLDVVAKGSSSEELVSIAFVNDYSASMLDHDLDVVETIQLDVLECLPASTEVSVTLFSEEVEPRLDFTRDANEIEAAVERDDDFERSMTALYDGMGYALDELTTRDRPVRVLVVASDGLENASVDFTQAELRSTIEEEDVVVVMLGTLFADQQEMLELSGDGGVYFYTPFYDDMRDYLAEYVASLKNMVELTLPPQYAVADRVEVVVDGDVIGELQLD